MSGPVAPTLDAAVLTALAESVGGDRAFVADLVATYLTDGAGQVAAIAAAVATGDAAALIRPAHTLKSASYTVGAMRVGDLARALELRGRAGGDELVGAQADAEAVGTEWQLADAALRSWLEGHV